MKLWLIRHGETHYSAAGRYCGWDNPSLNQNGIQQIRALANYFKAQPVETIFSSPLLRARDTARILFPDRSVSLSSDLRELSFGKWEGLIHAEIPQDEFHKWLQNPLELAPPEGETLRQLTDRIHLFIDKQLKKLRSNTAIVSHAGPIRILLCFLLNKNFSEFWNIPLDLGHFYEFEMKHNMFQLLKGNADG